MVVEDTSGSMAPPVEDGFMVKFQTSHGSGVAESATQKRSEARRKVENMLGIKVHGWLTLTELMKNNPGFGQVYRAIDDNGNKFVVEVLPPPQDSIGCAQSVSYQLCDRSDCCNAKIHSIVYQTFAGDSLAFVIFDGGSKESLFCKIESKRLYWGFGCPRYFTNDETSNNRGDTPPDLKSNDSWIMWMTVLLIVGLSVRMFTSGM